MSIPCSDTYLLEKRGRELLKVATKGCFRSKKNLKFSIFDTIFQEQKQCSATKSGVTVINIAQLYLPHIQFSGSWCRFFIQSSHQSFFKR